MVELIQTKVKKWGNSFATIIPNKVALNLALKENQKVTIMIRADENPLKALWNSGIRLKGTAQEFKDRERADENMCSQREQ